ncbi:MAG: DUF2321 domain-containing protein [Candidatus Binataceae bacterium]
MDHYDSAQICLNGHVINDQARSSPQRGADFCPNCGSRTATQCPSCKTEIRGHYHRGGEFPLEINPAHYHAPAFCHNCGNAYPWTAAALAAANEIVEREETLTTDDKAEFEADVNDVIRDVPRTRAAAIRIKGFLAKIPGAAASALRDIVVDIASEAAKKIILGP